MYANRAPQRFVVSRGNKTTITRKSAPARIATATSPETSLHIPSNPFVPHIASSSQKRFSLSTTATPRAKSPKRGPHVRRRQTLDFDQASIEASDGDSDSSYNSFTLELRKKEALSTDPWLGIDDDPSNAPSQRAASPSVSFTAGHGSNAKTYRVLSSHYEGDLFKSGDLCANLIVGPGIRTSQSDSTRALYRWIHVENPEMNFGAYIDCVLKCSYLSDDERNNVSSILKTAREKSDRSLRMPAGMKGNYAEPEYFEESIESTIYEGPRSKSVKTQVVRWLCIPYFFLGTSASTHAKDKNESDSDLGPDEDPQFFKTGSVAEGDFFQVAQFWCLVVGDGLIFTCGRRAIHDFPGHLIHITQVPPTDPTQPRNGSRSPTVQVSDGGIRLWILPLDQCETWPAFSANFVGLGFSLSDGWEMRYKDYALNIDDWPRVVAFAKRSGFIRLTICKADREDIDDSESDYADDESEIGIKGDASITDTGVEEATRRESSTEGSNTLLKPTEHLPQITSPPSSPKVADSTASTATLSVESFHVFTLLATKTGEDSGAKSIAFSQRFTVDEKLLQQDLSEMDIYLSTRNNRHKQSEFYMNGSTKSTYEVETSINGMIVSQDQNDIPASQYGSKLVFARSARDLFQFFFPLRYEHRVTQKYWGAVDRIIRTPSVNSPQGQFALITKDCSHLARLTNEIKQELFAEKNPKDWITSVPHEFIQAWMMLLMCFVMFPTNNSSACINQIRRCKQRLLQGRAKMIERLQTVNIREREAVLPLGVTCLLLGQLLHDSSGPLLPERHRLTTFYWTYLQNFAKQVREKPLSRKYQDTFTTLKAELETVIAQLGDQQRVLTAFDDSIDEARSYSFLYSLNASSTSPDIGPSREVSITEYLLQQTEEMMQNFSEMARRTEDLESWHFRMIDSNKDKQDKAALTFTTVTVFFLPLTTLASILGMNTNDIRNMTQNQWIFWAVAVPMCAVGGVAWLMYLGTFRELRRQKRKDRNRFPKRKYIQ